MRHELILHHYDGSPYSEKIRLLFGYKGLDWRSVTIAPMLPKPGLMTLTRGYRRAPVLQVGADIYCDSALIVAEIERRFPLPALAGGARKAGADLLSHLVDVDLFWQSVRYVMGARADSIPQVMLDDRARMHPQMNFERAALAAAMPQMEQQLRPVLSMLDAALGADDFFGGALPAGGDFGLYHPLWFLQNIDALTVLAPRAPALRAWMARMAAFGKGNPSPLSQVEAIAIALAATPAPLVPGAADADAATNTGFDIGAEVEVQPANYPREGVRGRLVLLDGERVVVAHESDAAGLLHVHFPRLGYLLRIADLSAD